MDANKIILSQKHEKSNAIKKIMELNTKKVNFNKNLPAITVKNFTMSFKKFQAVKNVTFTVGNGVIHGFIGPNGSGKTTTIKAMIGAYIPSSGKIEINGHKSGTINANKLIGYIPEKAAFPKHLNAVDYLSEMAELTGIKPRSAKKKAIEILNILGLKSHANRKPKDFSSGMQKKMLLAQALLTNPQVLILDEPAANLDPTARKELFEQLISLRNQGKTILISSHILSELERIVNEVTFIYYGDIIYSGNVELLGKQNTNIFVKSSNNMKLSKLLIDSKIEVFGDFQTEIEVHEVENPNIIFELAMKNDIKILAYRSNDLFSSYEKLILNAQKNNLGNQFLGKRKVEAVNRI